MRRERRIEKLEDQVFNNLLVKKYLGYSNYLCICIACGSETTATSEQLKNNLKKSCGCLRREYLHQVKTTHGESHTRLYRIYKGIKERCYHPTDDNKRKNYYERGITMCDIWKNDYLQFKNWAYQNGYKDNLTIDRIDNDKDYSPENCRWIPRSKQASNRRNNVRIEINNEIHTIAEWCEINNINKDVAYKRIEQYGWSPERAVTQTARTWKKNGPYSRNKTQNKVDGI